VEAPGFSPATAKCDQVERRFSAASLAALKGHGFSRADEYQPSPGL